MTNGVTYRTENLTAWNASRRGDIELDALARVSLSDVQITDRDRIAFALRELCKRGYEVETRPVDWTTPLMICSGAKAPYRSFGLPLPTARFERFDGIAKRARLTAWDFERLLTELYPAEAFFFFEWNDYLEHPYEFLFRGDATLVEAVFQAVGFATQHGLLVPDDGSETHHHLGVAPPAMVIV